MNAVAAPVSPDPIAEQSLAVFTEAWTALEARVGRSNLRFPKEIIWLNGAPGSGKGTNTPFIQRERGIIAPPVVVSSLLNSPEFETIKAKGNLIADADVVRILLQRLLDASYTDGVVVDGFPRTKVQAECVRHLHRKMLDLRKEYAGTPLAAVFPTPVFRITVLWVGEKESLDRQLKRGRQIIAHNQRVRESGEGDFLEERPTDTNEDAARKRYRIFQEMTLDALQGLKKDFHYHLINAQGDIRSVEENINHEFQYQSTLELESETLDAVNHIPLAADVVLHARQNLVRRLDGYQRDHAHLLRQVIWIIEQEFLPAIQGCAVVGHAHVATENPLLAQPVATAMVVDILSERGYLPTAWTDWREVPVRIDPATGAVTTQRRAVWRFDVRFRGSHIRRGQ